MATSTKYKITKPIRLIEFFSGYGSQYFALKYLNADVQPWKTCEWNINSILAYYYFHNELQTVRTTFKKENLIPILRHLGVSADCQTHASPRILNAMSEEQLNELFTAIEATHNLVDITKVHGEDLDIDDINDYEYVLTYSFPCQDLSTAGKQAGMVENSNTRSSLLWEVGRILSELNDLGTLPNILIMENVTQVHNKNNIEIFEKWQQQLKAYGYSNFYADIDAQNCGIPQHRNRCFMISILGEHSYVFKDNIPLTCSLSDFLEQDVPDEYFILNKNKTTRTHYLANKILEKAAMCPTQIVNGSFVEHRISELEKNKLKLCNTKNKNIAQTLTTGMHMYWVCVDTPEGRTLREFTPRECLRLMGVHDNDIDKIINKISKKWLRHLAGDSIVINSLMHVFSPLLED